MSAKLPAPEASLGRDTCPRCRELEKQNTRLSQDNERLKARVERLEGRAVAAERAAKRQAAPFSKGSPKPDPKKPGRRPGPAYGVRARRRVPEHVDETIEVPLADACPECGGAVRSRHEVADQYQTEIPPVRPHVTHFRVHLGRCADCGRAVRGRDPRQTSDAFGACASQLGPRAVALAAHLNKGLGLSYDKCRVLYHTAFGIDVSPSGLCQALDRLAAAAAPTYEALVASVQTASVVSADETGWKVGGERSWLWTFATPELTVYRVEVGRGFAEAASVLGADYSGVLIRDGWAPYRSFEQADHQSCLAHLLRRARELIDAALAGAARFPHAVRRILLKGLALRDRYLRGELSSHGLAVARGRLEAEMDRLLQWNVQVPDNRRFRNHLRTEQPWLFTFLYEFDVEATNWWAEQAIRPAVVTRKVCGGNRTWSGALTQETLASVLATARKQDLDPIHLLGELYRAPEPSAVPLLAPPLPQPRPP